MYANKMLDGMLEYSKGKTSKELISLGDSINMLVEYLSDEAINLALESGECSLNRGIDRVKYKSDISKNFEGSYTRSYNKDGSLKSRWKQYSLAVLAGLLIMSGKLEELVPGVQGFISICNNYSSFLCDTC